MFEKIFEEKLVRLVKNNKKFIFNFYIMLQKQINRIRRKIRVRSKIQGTKEVPRLSIFRSNLHISAQIIDDVEWKTLVSFSDLKLEANTSKTERAKFVWQEIAKLALEKKVSKVVFDRNGFLYHGRVKTLADSAREAWLIF